MNVWDNPRLLNMIANGLLVFAVLIALGLSGKALVHSPMFSLRTLQIHGALEHVDRASVVSALQGQVSGTFFTVDLEQLRTLFEAMPWVRRAEIRRLWPDRLEVRLEEHRAIAHWGRREDGRLVNHYGEVFSAAADADLPYLVGPSGSEGEVSRRYAEIRSLLAPLGVTPRQVLLSDRRSWQVRLDNGLMLQLGRDLAKDTIAARLGRFIAVYPRTLAALNRRLEYVDLRYPDGFALRVTGLRPAGRQTSDRPVDGRPPA